MATARRTEPLGCGLLLCGVCLLVTALFAGNDVLGEIQLVGATKVEKTSGVWIDGQYVGYLKELKGSKRILLLPGDHEIVLRQAGYQDFATEGRSSTWRKAGHPGDDGEGSASSVSDGSVAQEVQERCKHIRSFVNAVEEL